MKNFIKKNFDIIQFIVLFISILLVFIGCYMIYLKMDLTSNLPIILIWIGTIPIFILLILCLFSNYINSKFFCEYYDWHKEPKEQTFNGSTRIGKCPVCGKEVMQDSQGNWF